MLSHELPTQSAAAVKRSFAMRCWTIGGALLSALMLFGCSGKPSTTGTTASQGQAGSTASLGAPSTGAAPLVAVPATAAPDYVVSVFLNALRSGDSPTTESLLTSKARQELARHALSVDVQSAPNATYQIRAAGRGRCLTAR